MNLRDYLHFERISTKSFAESLELTPMHLYAYLSGRIRVSKKVARAIEKKTQGKVTAEEIIKGNPSKNKIYKKDPLK